MGEVVNPRALTYSGTSHQWFIRGLSASRTFPTICDHMWRVAYVSCQAARGSSGQRSELTGTAAFIGPPEGNRQGAKPRDPTNHWPRLYAVSSDARPCDIVGGATRDRAEPGRKAHARRAQSAHRMTRSRASTTTRRQLLRNPAIQIHRLCQLLFLHVLTVGVGHVNRSWPDQQRLAPLGQRGNVGRKGRHHGRQPVHCAKAHERNLQIKLHLRKTAHGFDDPPPQLFCRPTSPYRKLCFAVTGIPFGRPPPP